MAVFAYRGRAGGGAVTGEIEADSRPAAVTALRAKGVIATSVQEKAVKAAAAAAPKKFGGSVKDKDLAIYTRQFATMFKNMGAELPLPTKIVMWMSDMTRKYVIFMLAGVAAAFYAIKRYYGTDQGSMLIDTFALKVPVIGMLIRKVAVARFTRTLGTLISSGVPILEGLLITARSAGNRVVEKAVMQARQHVTAGGTLSEPLKATPVFPPMVVHMISVGENTGALDAMLSKIADFYDDEVDAAVTALTSLLEPMMIVFLGVVVGGIVVAMYLPIFKMVTLVK